MPLRLKLAQLITSVSVKPCDYSRMAALPLDLTIDMAAIAEHHQEGIRLHREGGFTEEEWSEHQRIT